MPALRLDCWLPGFAPRFLFRPGRRLDRLRFRCGLARGAARFGGSTLFAAAARAPCVQQADSLFERNRFRGEMSRQGGVDPIMGGIGPVPSALDHDGPTFVGMIAERASRISAAGLAPGPPLLRHLPRAPEARGEDLLPPPLTRGGLGRVPARPAA